MLVCRISWYFDCFFYRETSSFTIGNSFVLCCSPTTNPKKSFFHFSPTSFRSLSSSPFFFTISFVYTFLPRIWVKKGLSDDEKFQRVSKFFARCFHYQSWSISTRLFLENKVSHNLLPYPSNLLQFQQFCQSSIKNRIWNANQIKSIRTFFDGKIKCVTHRQWSNNITEKTVDSTRV